MYFFILLFFLSSNCYLLTLVTDFRSNDGEEIAEGSDEVELMTLDIPQTPDALSHDRATFLVHQQRTELPSTPWCPITPFKTGLYFNGPMLVFKKQNIDKTMKLC